MCDVLVIAPDFHYFAQSITHAFEQLGLHTHCETYDNPIHPYTLRNQLKYKIGNKDTLKEQSRQKYKPYIEQIFDTLQPKLVFVVNGDNLLPETVEYMHQRAKIAIWLFDSIQRFPIAIHNLPYADKVFCYEKEDIAHLKNLLNINALFLPQAADNTLYYPIKTADKDLDIVFAGDIWQSEKRQQVLQKVVAHYSDKHIRIWGIYKPWYKGLWRWLTREHRNIYTNRNTNATTLNMDYNRAKIVLNIHHEQQHNGANPKVFEICATGAYQICDANPYLEQLFPNGEIGLYHNEQELFSLIDYALTHNMSAQANAARQIVLNQHTFVKRMEYVIHTMGID